MDLKGAIPCVISITGGSVHDVHFLDDLIIENTQCLRQAEIYSNIFASLMDARVSVVNNNISVEGLSEPLVVFDGSALDAVKAFPANVNVAAALSLAGIGAERTKVRVVADPAATGTTPPSACTTWRPARSPRGPCCRWPRR